MPTRNISLTQEQDAFVRAVVTSGEYQNASEAVRDALRALQQRRKEDALKLRALRFHIKAGAEALKRGDFTEIADRALGAYLDGIAKPAHANDRGSSRIAVTPPHPDRELRRATAR